MKTVREVFESVRSQLHWGPALAPYHECLIDKVEFLESRLAEVEGQLLQDKEMMDMMRSEWNEMFQKKNYGDPKYITEEASSPSLEKAAADALSGHHEDDPASIVDDHVDQTVESESDEAHEQNPAEPVQTPVPDLLKAKPEPVLAGPDTTDETPPTQEVAAASNVASD